MSTITNLPPLFAEFLQPNDTDKVIELALEISANHPYYAADNSKPRFATFLTKEEATHHGQIKAILVPTDSWYAVYRFQSSIREARKQLKFN